jgi:hypothetical protein
VPPNIYIYRQALVPVYSQLYTHPESKSEAKAFQSVLTWDDGKCSSHECSPLWDLGMPLPTQGSNIKLNEIEGEEEI